MIMTDDGGACGGQINKMTRKPSVGESHTLQMHAPYHETTNSVIDPSIQLWNHPYYVYPFGTVIHSMMFDMMFSRENTVSPITSLRWASDDLEVSGRLQWNSDISDNRIYRIIGYIG